MAIAVSERVSAPTQDPLWWRLVTDPLWTHMKNKLTFSLEGSVLKEQERITRENEALHKLARERDLLILTLGLVAIATIAGVVEGDKIISALNLNGENKPPVTAPHPGFIPDKGLEPRHTPVISVIKATPKPTETLTPFPTPTETPTLVPTEKSTATPSFVENGYVKPNLPIVFNGSDSSDWAKLPRDANKNIMTGQVVRFQEFWGVERAGMAAVVYSNPYFENGNWYVPLMADAKGGVVRFKLNIGGDGVHGSPAIGIFEVNNGRWGNSEGWPTVDPVANKDLFKPGVEVAFDFWLKFDPNQCGTLGADGPTCDRYKRLVAEYGARLNELAKGSPIMNGDEIGLVNNLAIAVKK